MSRKGRAAFLLFVFSFGLASTLMLGAPRPAYAQYTDPITSIQTTLGNVWNTIKEGLVQGAGVAVLNGANYFLQQMAYQLALAILNDCPGQKNCWSSQAWLDNVKQAGEGALGEAIGTLSKESGWEKLGFNLCAPPSLDFQLSIQLGLLDETKPPAPKCDFNKLVKGYSDFANSLSSEQLLSKVKIGFVPGQSGISAGLKARGAILGKQAEAQGQAEAKNLTDASAGGGFSGINDPVSGRVKTPPVGVKDDYERLQRDTKDKAIEANAPVTAGQLSSKAIVTVVVNAISTFAQTLITRLLNKIIKGLLTTEQLVAGQPDIILSREGQLTAPGRSASEASIRSSLSFPAPRALGNVDPLLDFTVCPTSGRTQQNCVVDAQFANAVRVADAAPLTVRTAIEQGMLHGDWPLISARDQSRNQDPFCYTYGYCEGNLKKLRAVRIISIGWEIAAAASSISQPANLKDVMDRFNDCNIDGELDVTHPFCHLIDPDWVLKMPPAQCKAKVYGTSLLDPSIPTRTELCVDQPTCLRQDDKGACVGGFGYCTRERNVWRFNGDQCPAQYNTCRTLTPTKPPEQGQAIPQANFLLNTIEYGVCSAGNAGCQPYSIELNSAGTPSDITDDWTKNPARYFNRDVQNCDVADAGCTGLFSLGRGQALNLIKNGGFELIEDGDADGNGDHASAWSPFGRVPSGRSGSVSIDPLNATQGNNAVFLDGADNGTPRTMGTCSQSTCLTEGGCTCLPAAAVGFSCRVGVGDSSCFYTDAVVQDMVPIKTGKTYTFAASFKNASSGAPTVNGFVTISLIDSLGQPVTIAAGDVNRSPTTTCTVVGNVIRLDINGSTNPARGSCTFAVNKAGVEHGEVRLFAGAGNDVFVDEVQLEEGGGTSFHEAYGVVDGQLFAKLPPAGLGCTGDATDREECASFAGMCRPTEVGCELYTPKNGDPGVPGIVGPQDTCPAECVGYDAFKQEGTDFEREIPGNPEFEYFIPKTAQRCSAAEVGCSEFTNLDTEAVSYFTKLRICQRPADTDSQIFYTWEGSDTTGFQLKVWNLKRTGDAARNPVLVDNGSPAAIADGTASDICADPASPSCVGGKAGVAPCTKIDAATNTCINAPASTTEGICNRDAVDTGDFDCREMYDADGNRHYRLLSRTIIATNDCHPYRISRTVNTPAETTRFQNDCTATNGKWDAVRSECVYQASELESRICSQSAKDCRSYKGNAATNVRTDFVDDFESGLGSWTDSAGGSANIEQSPESITVGGHSLKVKAGDFTTLRDVTNFVFPGRNYQISFWARGSGQLTVQLQDAGPSNPFVCTIGGQCLSSTGCTCTGIGGRGTCTVPQNSTSCNISATTGTNPPASVITISSGWQQYTVGPIVSASPLWAMNKIRLSIDSGSSADYFLDNVILKDVQDNINVVRGSWVTPASCDQTAGGASSPQEMLGCREYVDTQRAVHTLRSFSQLCREKAIGCAAFSTSEDTIDNPYEESFNAVCKIDQTCASAPSCVCNYDIRFRPIAGGAVSNTPVVLNDVCRVAVGESECRFNMDRWDNSTTVLLHPDRVNISADKRMYLVVKEEHLCDASAASCKNVGLPHTAFESQCVYAFPQVDGGDVDGDGNRTEKVLQPGACEPANADQNDEGVCINAAALTGNVCTTDAGCGGGTARCSKFRVDANTCRCTHPDSGATCTLAQGGNGCSLNFEGGIVDKWKALTLKDDPAQYVKNLCLATAVGCEEYTSTTGTVYFKDPGDKLCVFKENVQYNNNVVTGWFRKSDSGTLAPCYSELLRQGEFYEIYRNQDPGCAMPDANNDGAADLCVTPGGCLCEELGQVICEVPEGERQCGFEGWVGQCQPEFDRCEEFVDPVSTSTANPKGLPYYYLQNEKLDTSSCAGNVSLKQGCVLLKQTSNTLDLYSAAASYLSSTKNNGGDRVPPLNCDLSLRNQLCEKRCFGQRNSICSNDRTLTCTVDSDCGVGNTCLGEGYYGAGCQENSDCNQSLGEICKTETGTAGNRAFTNNDANVIVKVRQDRECANWLTCSDSTAVWSEEKGRYEQICTGFRLCDQNHQVGQTFECANYLDEKPELLTPERYARRDTTYGGLDFSGFSLAHRYPAQFMQPFDVSTLDTGAGAGGTCVNAGTNDGKACNADGDCGAGGYCSTDYLHTRRFGALINNIVCRDDAGCPLDPNFTDSSGNPIPPATADSIRGKCVSHRCAYNFDGGPLKITGLAGSFNAASCRAYPEGDSPFPKDVLDITQDTGDSAQDGYDDFGNPLSKKSAFKGANVCTGGSNCECSYLRVAYGSGGGFTRFHNLNRIQITSPIVAAGVCIGGPYEGKTCTPGLSPQTACGDADQGGSCSRITRKSYSLGWPGFCIDYDTSLNINGNQDKLACNLWLPIDKLSGAPDLFNQYTEAGFQEPADGVDLTYCSVTTGAKTSGGDYLLDTGEFHNESGGSFSLACSNNSTTFPVSCSTLGAEGTCNGQAGCRWIDRGCRDKCGDDAMQNAGIDFGCSFSPDCIYDHIRTACDNANPNGSDPPAPNCDRGPCDNGDGDTNFNDGPKSNGECAMPPSTNWFEVSWEDHRETKQVLGIAGLKRDQIVAIEIRFPGNVSDSGQTKRMYLYEGNDWTNGFSWSGNDDGIKDVKPPGATITENGEIVGDGSNAQCETESDDRLEDDCKPTGKNCIGARVFFKSCSDGTSTACNTNADCVNNGGTCLGSDDTMARMETDLCHNASTFGHYVKAEGLIYFREACSELVRVYEPSRPMKGAVYTQKIMKTQPSTLGGVAGYTYNVHTTRPRAEINDLAPYGFAVFDPLTANPDGHEFLPVWYDESGTEKGSPYINLRYPGGTTPYLKDAGLTSDGKSVVGRPFGCIGAGAGTNCTAPNTDLGNGASAAARGRIDDLFAYAFQTYTLDRPSLRYQVGTGSLTPYDTRAVSTTTGGNPTGVPHVVPVITDDIAPNSCTSEGICQEGVDTAGTGTSAPTGLTVCIGGCRASGDIGPGVTTARTKAEIRFYAYADKNHMSIRRKIVDFGDGSRASDSGPQSFYKNHRGLTGGNVERCEANSTDWGLDSEACDSRYFSEVHTYVCNTDLLLGGPATPALPDCAANPGVYPCQRPPGLCVFRPRIHIRDSWDVCNGKCPGLPGTGDVCINGDYGYDGPINQDNPQNECPNDIFTYTHGPDPNAPYASLPPTHPFKQGKFPWTEYAGEIILPPQ